MLLQVTCAISLQGRTLSGSPKIFFSYMPSLAKTPCPVPSILSHPPMDKTEWTFVLRSCMGGWIQYHWCNILWPMLYIYGISGKMSYPIPSYPSCRQDWNVHVSASNQDRALTFCSYERSLTALSGFYNLVAMVTFPSTITAKRSENKKLLFWACYSSQNRIFRI